MTTPPSWDNVYGAPDEAEKARARVATVELLLDRGADINKFDTSTGYTPLHAACMGNVTIEVMRLLLRRGAEVDLRATATWCTGHNTPLLELCLRNKRRFLLEEIKLLLDYGADLRKSLTELRA